jgi:4'-phosphopantetheinyl transferase
MVQLEASQERFDQCHGWLSADEKARAARFHFDEHRRAFALGRGVLRGLLGAFLALSPDKIQFTYGPKGKPALPDAAQPLRFNTSNCGNLAVYAFLNGCEIGIDVERVRPMPDMEQIAARFFAPEEAAELTALAEPDRTRAFFSCWTRKEAYIKAVGDGLAVALDSFRVTLGPGVPAGMLCLGGSAVAARAWTLHDFNAGRELVGALAYQDQARAVLVHPLVTAEELLSTVLPQN